MDHDRLKGRMLARERVANVKKHWVRCVTACNSRCVFCLDTDTPRNVYLPDEEVRRELDRGRNQLGADKVILSGGEGSIHPKFIEFVKYAKDIGYDRVQTVTNGVMFSKREFYNAAVEAGLGEITFSLHGHTPELHDRLTGTPGAFKKLMRGMVRAIRENRVIVNVDVCINKQNVPVIDKIVELCLSVGVREFDLLHVIPQGAAFENRDQLFYDPVEHLPRLQKVFRLNRHPNVTIWTNRFPVEFLEGMEDLIQDPHKMLDEVNGRRFQVRRYLDDGVPLECRQQERCQHCFIEPFCNTADRVIERQNQESWDVWWVGSPQDASSVGKEALPFGCRYVGIELDDLADLEQNQVSQEVGVYARVARLSAVPPQRSSLPLWLNVSSALALDGLLGADVSALHEIEIELNQDTAPWLLAHRDWLERSLVRVRLHQPSYEFLKQAVSNDVRDPKQFFVQLALPVRTSGMPACLTPEARLAEPPRILPRNLFDADSGRVGIRELARMHVVHGYQAKSLRCRGCRLNDRCDGAHINFLRDQGFGRLEPLREGEWADAADRQLRELRPQPPRRLRDGRPVEKVAASLPGFAPPSPAPIEPLIEFGRRAQEARERRRLPAQKEAPPPA